MIPQVDNLYVPFGMYEDCDKLFESNIFFPTLLTGLSGVGKTVMIEQLCAKHQRECYRINITYQTDEDDLIGGLRLTDGNTGLEKGPVIRCMEAGGILLLDEVDLASPMLIMCLQSILEGKGYLIKKTGEFIKAETGFQIFATANTKGIGDETSSFVGTQVLNESFLERFAMTFECPYPEEKIEKQILTKLAKYHNVEAKSLISALVSFANDVRNSYINGSIEHTISPRRLIHIIKAFAIYKDEMKAVEFCLNRFDTHTKNGFMDNFKIAFESVRDEEKEKNSNINIGSWQAWS